MNFLPFPILKKPGRGSRNFLCHAKLIINLIPPKQMISLSEKGNDSICCYFTNKCVISVVLLFPNVGWEVNKPVCHVKKYSYSYSSANPPSEQVGIWGCKS